MVTRCVSCHLLCLHVWRTRHVGPIEPHMSDATLTHTYPIRTSLCREMGGGRAPQPCCLNSLHTACDSSPSPLSCATGAASRLFLWQENRQTHQMHQVKFLKSSSDAETKKKKEVVVLPGFLVLGRSEITVHSAWRHWLPNPTNQSPHCVDYLVNLLMPLSSIAGVNVPVFFPLPSSPSRLLLGRCSVGSVICSKRFLGSETRQENGVIVKSSLLMRRTEGTERRRRCQRGRARELYAPRHLLKYVTAWIMKEEEESAEAVPQWNPSQKRLIALRLLFPPAKKNAPVVSLRAGADLEVNQNLREREGKRERQREVGQKER